MKNYSKQREEILRAIKELHNHPTAEEVYEKIKEYNSTASRGTVYRNLKDLVSENMIIKISKTDGPDRYDYIRFPHHHIVCLKCGEVFDFTYEFNENRVKQNIENQTGVEFDFNGFSIQAICGRCKNELQ